MKPLQKTLPSTLFVTHFGDGHLQCISPPVLCDIWQQTKGRLRLRIAGSNLVTHQERAPISGVTPTEPTTGHGGRRSSSGQDAAFTSKMKLIEILDHVPPVLLREIEKAVPQMNPTKRIVGLLGSHRDLWAFVPKTVWSDYPRKGIRQHTLSSRKRVWCLAEMLAAAVRLRQDAKRTEPPVHAADTPLARAAAKIRTDDFCMRKGVRLLLQHILGHRGAVSMDRLVLNHESAILGMISRPGRDLVADDLPIFVGLCHLEVATRHICRLAEEFALTLEERGAILDALPRFRYPDDDVFLE